MHKCPKCEGYLTIVQRFKNHSDEGSWFGCESCDTVYRYQVSRRCLGGSSLILQKQSLKEYKNRQQTKRVV